MVGGAYIQMDKLNDLFILAYILMSGIMPFDDDCRSRLYTHIITANYVYYSQFWSGSDQAKQFVDSLLETSPEVIEKIII